MDMWAMALLREVWGEFVLVGASMGGYCALTLARLAPERVQALVLAGAPVGADSPERRDDRMDTIGKIQSGGAEALWDKMSHLLTSGASEEVAQRIHALALEQSAQDLIDAVRTIRDRPDSSDVLAGLEVPVRVVVGEADPLLSVEEAKATAAAAPTTPDTFRTSSSPTASTRSSSTCSASSNERRRGSGRDGRARLAARRPEPRPARRAHG
jgi:pimeloyl-ACP methyl ester carboxylesterase